MKQSSRSPQGDTRKNEEILLVPPEYALNKQTHNYEGLIEELERQKVTSLKEKCHSQTDRLWKTGRQNMENHL